MGGGGGGGALKGVHLPAHVCVLTHTHTWEHKHNTEPHYLNKLARWPGLTMPQGQIGSSVVFSAQAGKEVGNGGFLCLQYIF